MKAIIEVAKQGVSVQSARQQIAASRNNEPVDYRLSFESARSLFKAITPARLDLLDTLGKSAPCSIYLLAKSAGRNYSNVHTDVLQLEELGLIERTEENTLTLPFDAVEIVMPLRRAA